MSALETFRAALVLLVGARDEPAIRASIEKALNADLEAVDAVLDDQGIHLDASDPHSEAERRMQLESLGREDLWDRLSNVSEAGANILRLREPASPDLVAQFFIDAATCVERATETTGLVGETFRALSASRE